MNNKLKLRTFITPLVTLMVYFLITIIVMIVARSQAYSMGTIITASPTTKIIFGVISMLTMIIFLILLISFSAKMLTSSIKTLKLEHLNGLQKIIRTIFSIALIAVSALILLLTLGLALEVLLKGVDSFKDDTVFPVSISDKFHKFGGYIVNGIVGLDWPLNLGVSSSIGGLFWSIFAFTLIWTVGGIVTTILTSKSKVKTEEVKVETKTTETKTEETKK